MTISIEVINIDSAEAYMIYRFQKDGVREYLTPEMKFDRYIGSRGYIRRWSDVIRTVNKILRGEIK